MLAAWKRLVLVMVMAALPVHGLAAVVIPDCRFDDAAGSSAAAHPHGHDQYASAPDHDHDHDHPMAAIDFGSDHCGAGSTFATPVMRTGSAPTATSKPGQLAAAYRSGFIPEQPQRPPLA